MNWFEEWFDSPLYEKLYADRDEEEARELIDLLEETLNLSGCSHLLDLGCGRGRHAINLAQRGYRVTGIDLSEQAIITARDKARRKNLDIDFMVRDMRNPLPKTFDAIINLFTTFGYFSEDRENARILDSVVSMLEPGGIFVLDYMNSRKVARSFRASERGRFQEIEYEVDRYVEEGTIKKDITFAGGQLSKPRSYSERVKLYGLDWFKSEFGRRNLVIDKLYGDYRGAPFDPDNSPRLLIVSHRER